MKTIIKIILLGFILSAGITGLSAQEKKESAIINLSASTYKKEIEKGIVLVDYWAAWCPPCRKMNPILEEIATEYIGKVKVCKINTDSNNRFTTNQGIKSIPTLILYQDGEEIGRVAGIVSKQKLKEALDAQIAVYRRTNRNVSKE